MHPHSGTSRPAQSDTTPRSTALCAFLFLAMTWAWLGWRWPHLLHQFQDRDLFLTTGSFLVECMQQPAGLLRYISSFLTGSCVHPWLGAGLLAGCLAASGWLLATLCRTDARWTWTAFAPAAAVVWLLPEAGYTLFDHFDASWAFAMPLGLPAMTGLAALLRRSRSPWTAAVWTVAGYLLCGLFATGAVLLYVALAFRHRQVRPSALMPVVVAVTAVAALIPLIAYRLLWLDAPVLCYTAPLPAPTLHHTLWIKSLLPILMACLVPLSPIQPVSARRSDPYWLPYAGLACLSGLVCAASCHDVSFRTELKGLRLLEQHQFQALRELTRHIPEPTVSLLDMKAVAADFTQHLGDDFFDGFGLATRPSTRLGGNGQPVCREEFSFYSGLVNDCYHWAMEDMAFHRPTLHALRLMAACALVNGETQLALKYANILQHTVFQRKTGQQLKAWAEHPDLFAAHPVYSRIRSTLPHANQLTNDAFNPVTYYLQLEQGNETDLLRSLIATLYMNGSDLFLSRMASMAGPDHPSPAKHLQEAVAIFDLTTASGCAEALGIPAAVTQRAAAFLKAWRADPVHAPERLRGQFGDTYYYYLFKINQ